MNLQAYIKKIGPARFAEQTGLTIRAVYSYSSGDRQPSPKTARLIEQATKGKVKLKDCYEPADNSRSA